MKAKRLFVTLGLIVVMVVCFAFAACQPKTPTEPTKYTVTFDANGGTLTGEDDKEEIFRLICAAAPQLVFGQLRARTA